jgi:DnaJ-class molecular chaperone
LHCNGTGTEGTAVAAATATSAGAASKSYSRAPNCKACKGVGRVPVPQGKCTVCSGRGLVRDTVAAVVEIQPGVMTGHKITVPELGDGRCCDGKVSYGDLVVVVR